jgi:release factor glutamine methyltransferase
MSQVSQIPQTSHALYEFLKQALKQCAKDQAAFEARLMLEHRAGLSWAALLAGDDSSGVALSAAVLGQIEADLNARLAGKPLSRIYGEREFYGLNFHVNEHVLDPRPDTERIIDLARERFPSSDTPLRILDLGTGIGCLLVTLLHLFPQAQGLGVDISPEALQTAQSNSARNGVDDRAIWQQSDWFDALEDQERYDLIVGNPPYIRSDVIPDLAPEVKNHDPILALDGGNDGMDAYKKIFFSLFSHLTPSGIALFEIGFDQSEDVMRLGGESRFMNLRIHPDLAGLARVVEIAHGDK